MPDLPVGLLAVRGSAAFAADHVKADAPVGPIRPIGPTLLSEPGGRSAQQARAFSRIHRLLGCSEASAAPGLDLDEDDGAPPFGDQIDLHASRTDVVRGDAIPLGFEVVSRPKFTLCAQNAPIISHVDTLSSGPGGRQLSGWALSTWSRRRSATSKT